MKLFRVKTAQFIIGSNKSDPYGWTFTGYAFLKGQTFAYSQLAVRASSIYIKAIFFVKREKRKIEIRKEKDRDRRGR